ncbi:MAG: acetolactate synthase [Paludibacteraceae bacterium]|nr:acetolactate synthase [Paludibacteraceae bacterium]MBP5481642.1 acetolactate synthase [Paludibacteraceae bacterium]MBR5375067.1 acetolactate synthase [Paludibacteraceae bacterium]MBR5694658.1 acetolactate synthase [Paludibacteraceae bacterium]
MTINQISIFLENKFGRLNEILSFLSKENIRVIAATVADTSDYGILRLITSNQIKALQLLKANGVSANLNTVMAISVDSSIDKFAETIQCFTKAGISIEYMYCFSINQKAILVLRTNNIDAAHEVIRRYGMNNLSEAELNNL